MPVFTLRRVVALIGLAAACGLIWLFGPTLSLSDGSTPLGSVAARLGLIALLLLVVLAFVLWRERQRRRIMARLQAAQALTASATGATAEAPAALDETELCVAEAVAWTGARDRRADRLGSHAYALPWVLVLGPPGSGRSAYVAATQLEGAGPAREAGGTSWTLSEEAVLIELSDGLAASKVDGSAWSNLFRLISKARPRRPLDAIVLTVPLALLLEDQRATPGPAALPRVWLQAVMRHLDTAPPVYIAVTQCDQLLGFTAALDGVGESGALSALIARGADPAQAVQRGLQEAAQLLARRLPYRLASERDPARRSQAVELTAQVERVAAMGGEFVQDLMRVGPLDRRIDLRAVVLTAAPGESDQVIDAWREGFEQGFQLQRPGVLPAVAAPGFVQPMMRGMVLAEAGVGGRNLRTQRRTVAVHVGTYVVCALALLLTAVLWRSNYDNVADRIDLRSQQADQLVQLSAAPSDRPATVDQVLPLANVALQSTERDRSVSLGTEPVHVTLDLPTPAVTAATAAYARVLRLRFLPALRNRMAQQMQATQDLGRLHELLTLYLQSASIERWDAAAFNLWAQAAIQDAFPFDPAQQIAARTHLARLLPLMPEPGGLNPAVVAAARERLRRVSDPDRIYNQLRNAAASAADAPPIDVGVSLGAAGAQLLMLRPQAGLPSVIPGFYTKAGFYNVFLRRLPGLIRSDQDDIFVMGATSDTAQGQAVLQAVSNLYVRDYIREWRGVIDQTGLRALPDIASLVAGLQALSAPDSPLLQLVELVRSNTDLPLPGTEPTGLLARTANAVGGATAAAAVTGAVSSVAGAALPPGLQEWPGNSIRVPFLPLIALAGTAQQAGAGIRIQGALVSAYGVVSGIASAQNPQAAAHQAAAAVIGGQGTDALGQLRTQAAGLPKPLDGIFRDLYNNIWGVLLRMSLERVVAGWSSDVAPVCAQSIARRYPFGDADALADRDVLPKDFGAFFGPNGIMDKWFATYLAPFVEISSDGQLTLAARSGLRLELSREGLQQINRARTFRDLFFDAAGNLAVRVTLSPRYLDPRAFSATLQVDATKLVYRHEPPRPTDIRWQGTEDAASASIAMSLVNGSNPSVTTSGPWALFRLLDAGQRTSGPNGLLVTFALNETQVTYQLRGSSVSNPIVNRDWRSFRCVPRL